jgi:biliverdin reductase
MAQPEALRWGVVGLGSAGRSRTEALRQDPRAEVICGFRGGVAAAGLPVASSVEALLEEVDAVAICSPDDTHPALVEQALRAGRHVLVEYPLAPDPDSVHRLFDLAAQVGRVLYVEHIEVLGAAARFIRERAAGRELHGGALRFVGLPRAGTWSLAHSNVARLHRLVDAVGFPVAVESETREPDHLTAILRYDRHCTVELDLRAEPGARRRMELALQLQGGDLLQAGDIVFDRGLPVNLGDGPGLFLRDQRMASAAMLDGAPLPIGPEREAGLASLAMRLAGPTVRLPG